MSDAPVPEAGGTEHVLRQLVEIVETARSLPMSTSVRVERDELLVAPRRGARAPARRAAGRPLPAEGARGVPGPHPPRGRRDHRRRQVAGRPDGAAHRGGEGRRASAPATSSTRPRTSPGRCATRPRTTATRSSRASRSCSSASARPSRQGRQRLSGTIEEIELGAPRRRRGRARRARRRPTVRTRAQPARGSTSPTSAGASASARSSTSSAPFDDLRVGDVRESPDDAPVVARPRARVGAGRGRGRGTVATRWAGPCRRCLDPIEGDLDVEVHEVFVDRAVEGETYPIDHDTIDLVPADPRGGAPVAAAGAAVPRGLPRPRSRRVPGGIAPPTRTTVARRAAPRSSRGRALDVLRADLEDAEADSRPDDPVG